MREVKDEFAYFSSLCFKHFKTVAFDCGRVPYANDPFNFDNVYDLARWRSDITSQNFGQSDTKSAIATAVVLTPTVLTLPGYWTSFSVRWISEHNVQKYLPTSPVVTYTDYTGEAITRNLELEPMRDINPVEPMFFMMLLKKKSEIIYFAGNGNGNLVVTFPADSVQVGTTLSLRGYGKKEGFYFNQRR